MASNDSSPRGSSSNASASNEDSFDKDPSNAKSSGEKSAEEEPSGKKPAEENSSGANPPDGSSSGPPQQHEPGRNRTIMNMIYDIPSSNRPSVDAWVQPGEELRNAQPPKSAERALAQALKSVMVPRQDSRDASHDDGQSASTSDDESSPGDESGDSSVLSSRGE